MFASASRDYYYSRELVHAAWGLLVARAREFLASFETAYQRALVADGQLGLVIGWAKKGPQFLLGHRTEQDDRVPPYARAARRLAFTPTDHLGLTAGAKKRKRAAEEDTNTAVRAQQEAIAHYRTAIKLNPDFALAQRNLESVINKLGKQ